MRIRIIVASVALLLFLVSGLLLWRWSQPRWDPPTAENIVAVLIDEQPLILDQAEGELKLLFSELKRTRVRRSGKGGIASHRVEIFYGDNKRIKLYMIGDNRIEVGIKDGDDYRAKVFIVSRRVSAALNALILSGQETTGTQP